MSKKTESAALWGGLPETLAGRDRLRVKRDTAFGGMDSPFGGGRVMAEGENLSPRRFPEAATRLPRGMLAYGAGSGEPHGAVCFDGGVIFARGNGLYRVSEGVTVSLGTVSDTPKRFLAFGDRLYIYPDKLCLERGGSMPTPLELDTGIVEGADFQGSTVTLPKGYSWADMGFGAGDGLRVINEDDATPAPEGNYRILEVRGSKATVTPAFPGPYVSSARFVRRVPALERCCVCGDRVYGVIGRDIYVSAAGSATDFYTRPGTEGKGAARISTDTEGDFTALTVWQGYVVFFKEGRIYRLLGSRADSFTLQDHTDVGIPAPLGDTLCEVGGALYYCAAGGVYRYRGQEAERVSSLGGLCALAGCGGTDGYAYYLSVQTSDGPRMSLYLPEEGVWYPEDGMRAAVMLTFGGFLCAQDGEGRLWLTSSDGRRPACPFDEVAQTGAVRASMTLAADHFAEPESFRLTGLGIRATGAAGGTLRVWATYTAGEATETCLLAAYQGGFSGRLLRVPVIPRLCDGVTLRLEMAGDWVIHAISREYEPLCS
jgi:hypothetical protein